MLSKLDRYAKIKSAIGIEAMLQAEDKIHFNCVQLLLKKNVLVINKKLSGIKNIAAIVNEIGENIPVCISLSGKGVLHKKISSVATDEQKLLLSVLPNARIEDFYLQQYISDTGCFVSIIRKTILHDLLKVFNTHRLRIISVTLGPFVIQNVLPLMANVSSPMIVGNHNLFLQEGKIIDYLINKEEDAHHAIAIDTDTIESNLLVPYATVLQVLLGNNNEIGIRIDEVSEQRKEVAAKKIFEKVGWVALISGLIILLLNFILFTYYTGKYEQLAGVQAKYSNFNTALDSISKKVTKRESFLLQAGWMKPSLISYYADQIGATLPETITLNNLVFNPLDEQFTRKEKKLVFGSDTIQISGICNKPTDLNSWIHDMQLLNWIVNIEINNYTYDKKIGKGNFFIVITIK